MILNIVRDSSRQNYAIRCYAKDAFIAEITVYPEINNNFIEETCRIIRGSTAPLAIYSMASYPENELSQAELRTLGGALTKRGIKGVRVKLNTGMEAPSTWHSQAA